MNKYKFSIIALILALTLGIGYGLKEYHRGHQSTVDLETEVKISAKGLMADYLADETTANTKYLNKVMEVAGVVSSLALTDSGSSSVNLFTEDEISVVSCQLESEQLEKARLLQEGDEITVKGRCSGATFDVVLTRCVILKPL